jgi:hypothetical protein
MGAAMNAKTSVSTKKQNEAKTKSSMHVALRGLLTGEDNLLRLFSTHAALQMGANRIKTGRMGGKGEGLR